MADDDHGRRGSKPPESTTATMDLSEVNWAKVRSAKESLPFGNREEKTAQGAAYSDDDPLPFTTHDDQTARAVSRPGDTEASLPFGRGNDPMGSTGSWNPAASDSRAQRESVAANAAGEARWRPPERTTNSTHEVGSINKDMRRTLSTDELKQFASAAAAQHAHPSSPPRRSAPPRKPRRPPVGQTQPPPPGGFAEPPIPIPKPRTLPETTAPVRTAPPQAGPAFARGRSSSPPANSAPPANPTPPKASPWTADAGVARRSAPTLGQIPNPLAQHRAPAAPAAQLAPEPIAPLDEPTKSYDSLALIWLMPGSSLRLRRNPAFKKLIDELEDRAVDFELDDAAGDEDPLAVEDRREVFEVLARGEPTGGTGLQNTLASATRGDGKFVAKVVLVAADLSTPFDARERAKATITVVTPYLPTDREDDAPPSPLERATADARTFVADADELCPPETRPRLHHPDRRRLRCG